MPKLRIALVDDDDLFRDTLAGALRKEGFEVVPFADGRTALDGLGSEGAWREIDVIVLDWRMPDLDGPGVLQGLREAGVETPVVMLTSLGDQVYEEAALAFGAVDFVEKDRSTGILVRRLLNAAARQAKGETALSQGEGVQSQGRLQLDMAAKRARWGGKEVDLTVTEFDMVAMMARRPGRDVSYRELYDLVHGTGFQSGSGAQGYRSNVRGFIKRIRRKFADCDPEFDAIENYPGFGYRWRPPDGE